MAGPYQPAPPSASQPSAEPCGLRGTIAPATLRAQPQDGHVTQQPSTERSGRANDGTRHLLSTSPSLFLAVVRSGDDVAATAAAQASAGDRLNDVLDGLRAQRQLLFGRYTVSRSLERRAGGQGCVQFVHDPSSLAAYAVKFFFDRAAFERERALYADRALRGMMAATHKVCDTSATPAGPSAACTGACARRHALPALHHH
jgi:hypothetical protein